MTQKLMMQNKAIQLQNFLRDEIKSQGALTIPEFMDHVLGHPEYGYYITRDPIGKDGDFTTSPEISQIFGDMIGLWLADIWIQMGSPKRFALLECGPGRGTLMADIMRVTSAVDGFSKAAQITLLETSPILKEKQKQALSSFKPIWIDNLDQLSNDMPVLFVANEFFDALPVNQYQFIDGAWYKRLVDYRDEKFIWSQQKTDFDPCDDIGMRPAEDKQIFEKSDIRSSLMGQLASKLKHQGGAGLVIDYGHTYHAFGDTLQAMKAHKYVDALDHVGDADITSHVDFAALKDCAVERGADVFGMLTQGDFLRALGIQIHTSRLMESANMQQKGDLQNALHRLTHSDEMGTLFKVMGVGYGANIKAAGF